MFNSKLKKEVKKLEDQKDSLDDQIISLNHEVKQLKLDRKIEDEDIKHMIKMKQEAVEIEKQKFELKCEGEKALEIAVVKDKYRDKLEDFLKSQVADMKSMYSDILGRLPEINVRLKGDL